VVGISISKIENRFNELSIELTHKCTLKCVYCSSDADINNHIFLDLIKISETIKNVKKEFNINTVSLSGGETFLYPKFDELFKFLISQDVNLLIYTSGIIIDEKEKRTSLSEKIIEHLTEYKQKISLLINIQGHKKSLIEKINGIPDSYEIIEESIKKLSENDIQIEANIVPFSYNYKFLEKIVNFCIDFGFKKIHFLRFVPQGRGDNPFLSLNKFQFKEVNQKLASILKKNTLIKKIDIRIGHPINFLFLLNKQNFYNVDEHHYCRGGLDAPLILPDGKVSMCPAWKNLKKFYVGSIYNQKFKDIWYSENFKLFRIFISEKYKNLKEPCNNCKYINECRGKCVAQRILSQKEKINKLDLKDLIYSAPDPKCFKNI